MIKSAEEVAKEMLGIVRNPDIISEFQIKIAVNRLTAFSEERVAEAVCAEINRQRASWKETCDKVAKHSRAEALEEAAKIVEKFYSWSEVNNIINATKEIRALKDKP
jgi:hypothetical protein